MSSQSLIARFTEQFLGGILQTAVERGIDATLVVLTVLYQYFLGNRVNLWELTTPFVWLVCAIAAFHIIRATTQLWREINERAKTREVESPIYVSENRKQVAFVSEAAPAHFREKLLAISACCLFLLGLVSYLVKRAAAEPPVDPYSVILELNILGNGTGKFSGFWVSDPNIVCPANTALFISLTNLQANAAMVRTLSFKVLRKDGQWAQMRLIPSSSYEVYFGGDIEKVKHIEISQLEHILRENIGSHNTVRGWVLLDYPPTEDPNSFTPTFKVYIRDFDGVQFSSPALNSGVGLNSNFQDATMLFKAEPTHDLSKLTNLQHCGYPE
jgi:hypothetical protein